MVKATFTRWFLCLLVIAGFGIANSYAQAPNTYSFAPSSGTYTALSGGTNSTATGDDGTQSSIAIGFSFAYNGGVFTTFSLTTNGAITLGNAAPGSAHRRSPATGPAARLRSGRD